MLLDFIKNYLRIDGTEDDALIDNLILMGVTFIYNATGHNIDTLTVMESGHEMELICLSMTVGHFYSNRDFVVVSGAVPQKVPFTLQTLYSQLQRKAEGVTTV